MASRLDLADHFGAGHFGHDDVGDDKVEFHAVEQRQRFGAARTCDRFIAQVFERADCRAADSRIVFHQQNSGSRHGKILFGLGLHRRVRPDVAGSSLGTRQID